MTENPVRYGGPVRRGLAYITDSALVYGVVALTQLFVWMPLRGTMGIDEEWFHSGLNTEIYTLATISLPVWLYFSLMECSRWRATVGKRILRMQTGRSADLGRLGFPRAFVRTPVKLLPWELAHITNNFPTPMWYAENPGFRVGFAVVGILMGTYIATVCINKRRRAPHDWVVDSVVTVHTP